MFKQNLESLRGVAAFTIALGHSLIFLPIDPIHNMWTVGVHDFISLQHAVINLLLVAATGGSSLIVFFVLSGYVLGLSLDREKPTFLGLVLYYVRRILRICPAYVVSVLVIGLSISVFHQYRVFDSASDFFLLWYKWGATWGSIKSNLLLMSTHLNPIAWTVQVELVMSCLIPFAHFFSRRVGWLQNAAVAGLLIAMTYYTDNVYVKYAYIFYFGVLIPDFLSSLRLLLAGYLGTGVFIFSILTLCAAKFFLWQSPHLLLLVECLASVFIIMFIISDEGSGSLVDRFLNRPLIKSLGRISYSFYLFHFIVVYWIAYIVFMFFDGPIIDQYPILFGLLFVTSSVIATYFFASYLYQYVEKPMLIWGKRITERWSRLLVPKSE